MSATPTAWTRLGIIAGGGHLPREIVNAIADSNPFVLRINGAADYDFAEFDGITVSIGEIGKAIKAFKEAGCDGVCFAGYVTRPNLKTLRVDGVGARLMPKVLMAARKGDDALLRVILDAFDKHDLPVHGADEVLAPLKVDAGVFGAIQPSDEVWEDVRKAVHVAQTIGALDIGQGAVVSGGLVLALEAQEGTNAMLDRVATLDPVLRGTADGQKAGVIAKMSKPIQERRVDLPTVGLETVRRVEAAGLAGIAIEAGGALVVGRERVRQALDEAGLFLVGVERETDD